MTDHNDPDHLDAPPRRLTDDDVDAWARRSGAELRRPAPAGLTGNLRAARRRQQTTRAAMVGAAAVLVLVGGVFAITRLGDDSIGRATTVSTVPTSSTIAPVTAPLTVPLTVPVTTEGSVPATTGPTAQSTTTTSEPAATPTTPASAPAGATGPTILGVRDGDAQVDVLDADTLEVTGTAAAPGPGSRDGGVSTGGAQSASGAVTYHFPEPDSPRDDCNQTAAELWVDGAVPSGLPATIRLMAMSDDHRTGAVVGGECGTDQWVSVFDADRPDLPARQLIPIDTTEETVLDLQINADGSFVIVDLATNARLIDEGLSAGRVIVVDVDSGRIVVTFDDGSTPALPYTDCGWGVDPPVPVGTTGIAYAAYNCPEDGYVVVVHDLVTGESASQSFPDYAQTYETMLASGWHVDSASYTDPGSAWILVNLSADNTTVSEIYLAQGDGPTRRIDGDYSRVMFGR